MKKAFTLALMLIMIISSFVGCRKKATYTITFDSMGGTSVENQFVEEGDTVTKPTNPQKEGFTFIEWQYKNKTYDFNNVVSNDLTLTALFEINEGTEVVFVTLDYQNGQKNKVVEIVKGGQFFEPPQPQKQGFEFVGWTLDNKNFDFSSIVSENITLIAEWKISKKTAEIENTSSNTKPTGTNTDNTVKDTNSSSNGDTSSGTASSGTSENNTQNAPNYEETMLPYQGKWYLNGYADVYVNLFNIYQNGVSVSLDLDAFNIAIPSDKNSPVSPYTIYPYEAYVDNPPEEYWNNGFRVLCDVSVWQDEIAKHKLELGDDCIYLGGKQFVREQGRITMYDDTCYKAALGDWYMEGNSKSHISIQKQQNMGAMGDLIRISMSNFNINTLASSGNSNVKLYAARKNNWDKYGVQVNNNVLTISNRNGTKRFHRNAIRITPESFTLSLGKTVKLSATVLPVSSTDQSVTWKSSNTSVAVINGNTVKAVGKGTATITATSKVGGHTATCKITVIESPLTVSAHLGRNTMFPEIVAASMSISGGSTKYTTYLLKLYYNGTLICEENRSAVSIHGKGYGEYRLEVYVKDSNGNEATATETITF